MKGRTRLAVRLVVTALVLLLVAPMVAAVALPRLTGGAALNVLSGSMTPTFPVGSLLFVRPVTPEEVEVGDVITFQNGPDDPRFTTHRVVGITHDEGNATFTTKGDANKGADKDPVVAGALRGRAWFHVPFYGTLRDAVSSPGGIGILALLALIVGLSDRIKARFSRPSEPQDHQGQEVAPQGPPPAPRITPSEGERRERQMPAVATRLAREPGERVEQQVLLVRLAAGALERGQVLELVGLLRAHVVAISSLEMVISVVGTDDELDGAERLLRPYGIVESARSEVVSIGGEPEPSATVEPALLLPYAPAPRPVTDLELLVRPLSRNGHSR